MLPLLKGVSLWRDLSTRTILLAVFSLIANLLYAFYHSGLGLLSHSPWLLGNSLYYFLLAVARFIAILYARRHRDTRGVTITVGLLLLTMSGLLSGLLIHSLPQPIATVYSTIPMITIATVTFTKITLASITAIKHRGTLALSLRTVNAIRYAEVAVSLCTMQRSMLATFDTGNTNGALLNLLTGISVCVFILFLSIYLFYISRKEKTNGCITHP